MEKSVGGFGWTWNGEWEQFPDEGARDPRYFDPDDVHSLFKVYALGDLGVREHCKQLDEQGNGMMTGLERLMFESCWPGVKVSRHEVNVSDGTTNAFKAEVLSRRIKCDIPTAQKLIETFRGLQLRSQDVDQLVRDGVNGWDFYKPEDLPKIMVYLQQLDMELPELPPNPTVEYTDEGYVKYRLGYTVHGQLGPDPDDSSWNEEDDWPDPTEDDLTSDGTPDAFRSIPIGWNSQVEIFEPGFYASSKVPQGNGWHQEVRTLEFDGSQFQEVWYWRYADPKERDFLSDWYPRQKANYKTLWKGIMNCTKHRDLELIGKAMHADPDMEKLDRVQQSMLWTRYSLQKSKLEHRTKRFMEKMIKAVQKYPVTKKFRINGKILTMGQLIFLYQKEQRMNLSSAQWTKVWAAFKARQNNTFRPNCSELNF